MYREISTELKQDVTEAMTKNCAVLRTMLHLSQEELASLIGVGRQTVAAIENRKRKMTWSVFLSLLFVYYQNDETRALLELLGIYTKEIQKIYSEINS